MNGLGSGEKEKIQDQASSSLKITVLAAGCLKVIVMAASLEQCCDFGTYLLQGIKGCYVRLPKKPLGMM